MNGRRRRNCGLNPAARTFLNNNKKSAQKFGLNIFITSFLRELNRWNSQDKLFVYQRFYV
jgi:hypothetical protein